MNLVGSINFESIKIMTNEQCKKLNFYSNFIHKWVLQFIATSFIASNSFLM